MRAVDDLSPPLAALDLRSFSSRPLPLVAQPGRRVSHEEGIRRLAGPMELPIRWASGSGLIDFRLRALGVVVTDLRNFESARSLVLFRHHFSLWTQFLFSRGAIMGRTVKTIISGREEILWLDRIPPSEND